MRAVASSSPDLGRERKTADDSEGIEDSRDEEEEMRVENAVDATATSRRRRNNAARRLVLKSMKNLMTKSAATTAPFVVNGRHQPSIPPIIPGLNRAEEERRRRIQERRARFARDLKAQVQHQRENDQGGPRKNILSGSDVVKYEPSPRAVVGYNGSAVTNIDRQCQATPSNDQIVVYDPSAASRDALDVAVSGVDQSEEVKENRSSLAQCQAGEERQTPVQTLPSSSEMKAGRAAQSRRLEKQKLPPVRQTNYGDARNKEIQDRLFKYRRRIKHMVAQSPDALAKHDKAVERKDETDVKAKELGKTANDDERGKATKPMIVPGSSQCPTNHNNLSSTPAAEKGNGRNMREPGKEMLPTIPQKNPGETQKRLHAYRNKMKQIMARSMTTLPKNIVPENKSVDFEKRLQQTKERKARFARDLTSQEEHYCHESDTDDLGEENTMLSETSPSPGPNLWTVDQRGGKSDLASNARRGMPSKMDEANDHADEKEMDHLVDVVAHYGECQKRELEQCLSALTGRKLKLIEASKSTQSTPTCTGASGSEADPGVTIEPLEKEKPQLCAPRGVPTISTWRQTGAGCIEGIISGSPHFADGDPIATSKIRGEAVGGTCVETYSGSRYFLEPNIHNNKNCTTDREEESPSNGLVLDRCVERQLQAGSGPGGLEVHSEALREKKQLRAPEGVPKISSWQQTNSGCIEGLISGSPHFKDGDAITTSKIKGEPVGGTIVETYSGSRYFMEPRTSKHKKAGRIYSEEETTSDDVVPKRYKGEKPQLCAPRGVPTISTWRQTSAGCIEGIISGSPHFSDGDPIATSKIRGEAVGGTCVETYSGSRYFLDPNLKAGTIEKDKEKTSDEDVVQPCEEQADSEGKQVKEAKGVARKQAEDTKNARAEQQAKQERLAKEAKAAKEKKKALAQEAAERKRRAKIAARKEAEDKKRALAEQEAERKRQAEETAATAKQEGEARKRALAEKKAEERRKALAEQREAEERKRQAKIIARKEAEEKKRALAEQDAERKRQAEEAAAAAKKEDEARKRALAENKAEERRRVLAEQREAAECKRQAKIAARKEAEDKKRALAEQNAERKRLAEEAAVAARKEDEARKRALAEQKAEERRKALAEQQEAEERKRQAKIVALKEAENKKRALAEQDAERKRQAEEAAAAAKKEDEARERALAERKAEERRRVLAEQQREAAERKRQDKIAAQKEAEDKNRFLAEQESERERQAEEAAAVAEKEGEARKSALTEKKAEDIKRALAEQREAEECKRQAEEAKQRAEEEKAAAQKKADDAQKALAEQRKAVERRDKEARAAVQKQAEEEKALAQEATRHEQQVRQVKAAAQKEAEAKTSARKAQSMGQHAMEGMAPQQVDEKKALPKERVQQPKPVAEKEYGKEEETLAQTMTGAEVEADRVENKSNIGDSPLMLEAAVLASKGTALLEGPSNLHDEGQEKSIEVLQPDNLTMLNGTDDSDFIVLKSNATDLMSSTNSHDIPTNYGQTNVELFSPTNLTSSNVTDDSDSIVLKTKGTGLLSLTNGHEPNFVSDLLSLSARNLQQSMASISSEELERMEVNIDHYFEKVDKIMATLKASDDSSDALTSGSLSVKNKPAINLDHSAANRYADSQQIQQHRTSTASAKEGHSKPDTTPSMSLDFDANESNCEAQSVRTITKDVQRSTEGSAIVRECNYTSAATSVNDRSKVKEKSKQQDESLSETNYRKGSRNNDRTSPVARQDANMHKKENNKKTFWKRIRHKKTHQWNRGSKPDIAPKLKKAPKRQQRQELDQCSGKEKEVVVHEANHARDGDPICTPPTASSDEIYVIQVGSISNEVVELTSESTMVATQTEEDSSHSHNLHDQDSIEVEKTKNSRETNMPVIKKNKKQLPSSVYGGNDEDYTTDRGCLSICKPSRSLSGAMMQDLPSHCNLVSPAVMCAGDGWKRLYETSCSPPRSLSYSTFTLPVTKATYCCPDWGRSGETAVVSVSKGSESKVATKGDSTDGKEKAAGADEDTAEFIHRHRKHLSSMKDLIDNIGIVLHKGESAVNRAVPTCDTLKKWPFVEMADSYGNDGNLEASNVLVGCTCQPSTKSVVHDMFEKAKRAVDKKPSVEKKQKEISMGRTCSSLSLDNSSVDSARYGGSRSFLVCAHDGRKTIPGEVSIYSCANLKESTSAFHCIGDTNQATGALQEDADTAEFISHHKKLLSDFKVMVGGIAAVLHKGWTEPVQPCMHIDKSGSPSASRISRSLSDDTADTVSFIMIDENELKEPLAFSRTHRFGKETSLAVQSQKHCNKRQTQRHSTMKGDFTKIKHFNDESRKESRSNSEGGRYGLMLCNAPTLPRCSPSSMEILAPQVPELSCNILRETTTNCCNNVHITPSVISIGDGCGSMYADGRSLIVNKLNNGLSRVPSCRDVSDNMALALERSELLVKASVRPCMRICAGLVACPIAACIGIIGCPIVTVAGVAGYCISGLADSECNVWRDCASASSWTISACGKSKTEASAEDRSSEDEHKNWIVDKLNPSSWGQYLSQPCSYEFSSAKGRGDADVTPPNRETPKESSLAILSNDTDFSTMPTDLGVEVEIYPTEDMCIFDTIQGREVTTASLGDNGNDVQLQAQNPSTEERQRRVSLGELLRRDRISASKNSASICDVSKKTSTTIIRCAHNSPNVPDVVVFGGNDFNDIEVRQLHISGGQEQQWRGSLGELLQQERLASSNKGRKTMYDGSTFVASSGNKVRNRPERIGGEAINVDEISKQSSLSVNSMELEKAVSAKSTKSATTKQVVKRVTDIRELSSRPSIQESKSNRSLALEGAASMQSIPTTKKVSLGEKLRQERLIASKKSTKGIDKGSSLDASSVTSRSVPEGIAKSTKSATTKQVVKRVTDIRELSSRPSIQESKSNRSLALKSAASMQSIPTTKKVSLGEKLRQERLIASKKSNKGIDKGSSLDASSVTSRSVPEGIDGKMNFIDEPSILSSSSANSIALEKDLSMQSSKTIVRRVTDIGELSQTKPRNLESSPMRSNALKSTTSTQSNAPKNIVVRKVTDIRKLSSGKPTLQASASMHSYGLKSPSSMQSTSSTKKVAREVAQEFASVHPNIPISSVIMQSNTTGKKKEVRSPAQKSAAAASVPSERGSKQVVRKVTNVRDLRDSASIRSSKGGPKQIARKVTNIKDLRESSTPTKEGALIGATSARSGVSSKKTMRRVTDLRDLSIRGSAPTQSNTQMKTAVRKVTDIRDLRDSASIRSNVQADAAASVPLESAPKQLARKVTDIKELQDSPSPPMNECAPKGAASMLSGVSSKKTVRRVTDLRDLSSHGSAFAPSNAPMKSVSSTGLKTASNIAESKTLPVDHPPKETASNSTSALKSTASVRPMQKLVKFTRKMTDIQESSQESESLRSSESIRSSESDSQHETPSTTEAVAVAVPKDDSGLPEHILKASPSQEDYEVIISPGRASGSSSNNNDDPIIVGTNDGTIEMICSQMRGFVSGVSEDKLADEPDREVKQGGDKKDADNSHRNEATTGTSSSVSTEDSHESTESVSKKRKAKFWSRRKKTKKLVGKQPGVSSKAKAISRPAKNVDILTPIMEETAMTAKTDVSSKPKAVSRSVKNVDILTPIVEETAMTAKTDETTPAGRDDKPSGEVDNATASRGSGSIGAPPQKSEKEKNQEKNNSSLAGGGSSTELSNGEFIDGIVEAFGSPDRENMDDVVGLSCSSASNLRQSACDDAETEDKVVDDSRCTTPSFLCGSDSIARFDPNTSGTAFSKLIYSNDDEAGLNVDENKVSGKILGVDDVHGALQCTCATHPGECVSCKASFKPDVPSVNSAGMPQNLVTDFEDDSTVSSMTMLTLEDALRKTRSEFDESLSTYDTEDTPWYRPTWASEFVDKAIGTIAGGSEIHTVGATESQTTEATGTSGSRTEGSDDSYYTMEERTREEQRRRREVEEELRRREVEYRKIKRSKSVHQVKRRPRRYEVTREGTKYKPEVRKEWLEAREQEEQEGKQQQTRKQQQERKEQQERKNGGGKARKRNQETIRKDWLDLAKLLKEDTNDHRTAKRKKEKGRAAEAQRLQQKASEKAAREAEKLLEDLERVARNEKIWV